LLKGAQIPDAWTLRVPGRSGCLDAPGAWTLRAPKFLYIAPNVFSTVFFSSYIKLLSVHMHPAESTRQQIRS